jgi:hypothetical protein
LVIVAKGITKLNDQKNKNLAGKTHQAIKLKRQWREINLKPQKPKEIITFRLNTKPRKTKRWTKTNVRHQPPAGDAHSKN